MVLQNCQYLAYKASAFVTRYSVRTFDEAVNIFTKYILENFQHSTFVV